MSLCLVPRKVYLDEQGYLYVEEVKVARLVRGELEFMDKDPVRSSQRGSRYVRIDPLLLLVALVELAEAKKAVKP